MSKHRHKTESNIVTNDNLTSQEGQPINNHSLEKNSKMKKQLELKPLNKEDLKSLLLEGQKITYIADHFGVARSTIRRKIKTYGIQNIRELGEVLQLQKEEERYCKLFMQLNGVKKIATDLQVGPPKVNNALRKYNLNVLESGKWTKVKKHVLNKEFFIPMSPYLLEVIIGELLGDGCIRIQMKGERIFLTNLDINKYHICILFLLSLQNQDFDLSPDLVDKFNKAVDYISQFPTAQFRYHVGINAKPWSDYLNSLFIREGYQTLDFIKEKKVKTPSADETTGFDTRSTVQLFDLYAKWYPNNKKIVPLDLELTPDILLHWYIGDGSLNYGSFYISTQSFTRRENLFLVKLLEKYVGIKCRVRLTKDGYTIPISLKKENLERFFDYLEKANSTSLKIAKETFPWKFDRYLSFKMGLKSRK